MCGFFGAFSSNNLHINKSKFVSLSHRGPDGTGVYENSHVYFKHFRLSILGSDNDASQPMVSFSDNIIIVFNGEIYNYIEIANYMGCPEYIKYGDTRILVEFIDKYGFEKINMLNGMFSVVIYDKNRQKISFLRDRFGIKPLYYYQDNHIIYFSSEIKGILNFTDKTLSETALRDYLELGIYPSGKNCFYNSIYQVEPSHYGTFDGKSILFHSYFSLINELSSYDQEKLSLEEFENLIDDSIKIRLRSDVPINIHYSGGTDSTALLCKIKENLKKNYNVSTYTMAYNDQLYDESKYAHKYSNELDFENYRITINSSDIPKLSSEIQYFQDEPYGGVPSIAYYKFNKAQKELGFTVALEGQGADESLGGYESHIYMAILDLERSKNSTDLSNLLAKFVKKDKKLIYDIAKKLIDSGFSAHTDLTDFRMGHARSKIKDSWLLTIQLHDTLINKIPRLLRFEDRGSMGASREVRFPFLDHRVFSYGMAFSINEKYKGGVSKSPLRQIIKRSMNDVYRIPKRSIVTPQTFWFQNCLRDWCFDNINSLKEKNIIEEKYFKRFLDDINNKSLSNSFFIWQMINLNMMYDNLIR